MPRRASVEIPADFRARLETARLDLLALFRALDRMNLTPEQIPQRLLRQLFELDADYVEALWGLDQPPGKLNLQLCSAIPSLRCNSYQPLARAFGKTFRPKPSPLSHNSQSQFAKT
jgi:hypothetical protein